MNKPSSIFYITGGTLPPDATSYIERQADHDLLSALMAGEYCYVLNSRQMGKSSLSVRTMNRLQDAGIRTLFLDLTRFGGATVTPEQWYVGMLAEAARALNVRKEALLYWKEHQDQALVPRFFDALRNVALQTNAENPTPDSVSPLVLFIDEIDAVKSLSFSTDEFFAALRECYNRRVQDSAMRRLTVCLVGSATPSDLIADMRTSPFNIGRRIELRDFTLSECLPLAEGLDRPNPSELVTRAFHWTHGHPYLTQSLCAAIAEDPSVRAPSGVDDLVASLFFEAKARERNPNLSDVANRILSSYLDPSRRDEHRAAILDLYGKVLRGRVPVADDETNQLVALLKLAGITRSENGRLRVRNRVYERVFDRVWIEKSMPDAELRRQKAAYRNGLLRASAVAGLILAVMAGLLVFAVDQRNEARRSAAEARNSALKAQAARLDADKNAADRAAALAEVTKQRNAAITAGILADAKSKEAIKNLIAANKARYDERSAKQDAIKQAAAAGREKQRADRRANDVEWLAYLVSMNLIPANYDKTDIAGVEQLLNSTRDNKFKGFEWGYWNRLCHLDLMTLKGHTDTVPAAAFSPDGRRIVTGGADKTAKVWDSQTGKYLLTLKGHTDRVSSAAFSPDGQRVVTGSWDKTAQVWDLKTGKAMRTLIGHTGKVHSVAFSPDGQHVVTGSDDKTANVWDLTTGRVMTTLRGHTEYVNSTAFSPDGRRIATGSGDKTAIVWDVYTGSKILVLNGHAQSIDSVAFSPDGRRIVTGSEDRFARVFDTKTGELMLTLKGHVGAVSSATFSPDGRRIVTGSFDKTAKVWDSQTAKELFDLKGHTDWIWTAAFSPDGRRIVTASRDKTAKVWDAKSDRETLTLTGHTRWIRSAAFSPDGRRIVTASGDATMAVDGYGIVMAGTDTTAVVWDAETGSYVLTLKGHASGVLCASFSPDGQRIVTGSADRTAKVWDARTGKMKLNLIGHSKCVLCASFSPDGQRIVTGGGNYNDETGEAKVWDARTGQEILTLKGHTGQITAAAFSPDGTRIVTGSRDNSARVWDAKSGREMHALKGNPGNVFSVAFSPDGMHIVTGSWGNTAQVWDAKTGKSLFILEGHTAPVMSVAYSPDGQRIVTGSEDRTAKVWDAKTGKERLTLKGHTSSVTSAVFSLDGKRIVTGSFDGTARVWFSDRGDWKPAMNATMEANAHLSLANDLARANKYDEAVSEYKEALRLRPDLGPQWIGNLGWYEYLAGRTTDSIKSSRRALELDPTLTYVRLNLGLSYATLNDWMLAKQEYDLGLKIATGAELQGGITDVQDAIKKHNNPSLEKALACLNDALAKMK